MESFYQKTTLIIAVIAIVSPILTTIINNVFQLINRSIDRKEQRFKETIQYKRNVIENYIRNLGAYLVYVTKESPDEYKQSYTLVLLYVPLDIRNEIIKIDALIKEDTLLAQQAYEQLIPKIEEYLGQL